MRLHLTRAVSGVLLAQFLTAPLAGIEGAPAPMVHATQGSAWCSSQALIPPSVSAHVKLLGQQMVLGLAWRLAGDAGRFGALYMESEESPSWSGSGSPNGETDPRQSNSEVSGIDWKVPIESSNAQEAQELFLDLVGEESLARALEYLRIPTLQAIDGFGSRMAKTFPGVWAYRVRFRTGELTLEVLFFSKPGPRIDEAARASRAAKLGVSIPPLILHDDERSLVIFLRAPGEDVWDSELSSSDARRQATRDLAVALGRLHRIALVHRDFRTYVRVRGQVLPMLKRQHLFWNPLGSGMMFIDFEDSVSNVNLEERRVEKDELLESWIIFLVEAKGLADNSVELDALKALFNVEYSRVAFRASNHPVPQPFPDVIQDVIEGIGRGIRKTDMSGPNRGLPPLKTIDSRLTRARQLLKKRSGEPIPSNHHAFIHWLHSGRWVAQPPIELVQELNQFWKTLTPALRLLWDLAPVLPISRHDLAVRLERSEETVDVEITKINELLSGLGLDKRFPEYRIHFWMAAILDHVYGYPASPVKSPTPLIPPAPLLNAA